LKFIACSLQTGGAEGEVAATISSSPRFVRAITERRSDERGVWDEKKKLVFARPTDAEMDAPTRLRIASAGRLLLGLSLWGARLAAILFAKCRRRCQSKFSLGTRSLRMTLQVQLEKRG